MTHCTIEYSLQYIVISSSPSVFYYRSLLVEKLTDCTVTAFARYIMAYAGFMLSENEIRKQLQFVFFRSRYREIGYIGDSNSNTHME